MWQRPSARKRQPAGARAEDVGGDERDVWQRADSSRQGLNGHRQVYSHLCVCFQTRVGIYHLSRNLCWTCVPIFEVLEYHLCFRGGQDPGLGDRARAVAS